MMGRRVSRGLGALVLLGWATSAAAQDTNYWAIQYGPVAQLIGGQVIASSRDLSATYYNPGGLALEEGSTFLLSTESFQVESYSTTPTSNIQVFDTGTTRFGTAPTLVAGALPRSWLGERTRLAWSFLTRQELQVRLGSRLTDNLPIPNSESATELLIDARTNESWAGLTASYEVSEAWGVGATFYGVYRGQRSRNELNFQAVSSDLQAVSGLGVTDFDYYHFRALAKAGIAYDTGAVKVGLNVTTPSLGLFGSGSAGYTLSLIGIDIDGTGTPNPPILNTQNADDLNAQYKSSWAVGGGIAFARGATQFNTSFEWFAPVDRFDVIELPREQDNPRQIRLSQELKSVFNFGVGVEHDFGNDVAVYGAMFTDFSAAVGDPEVNTAISNWNLYHLSTGVKFHFVGNRFTLGATYSFGSKDRPLPTPIPPADAPGLGLDSTLGIDYQRVVVLLGFLFGDAR